VASWGILGFPEALGSYIFIYSRFSINGWLSPSPTVIFQQRVFSWSEGLINEYRALVPARHRQHWLI
jgi:hypothetical protein